MDGNESLVEGGVVEFKPALLIVDDEAYICSAIQRIFERKGIEVHKAYSAMEAVERLKQIDVQVVISDYYMPGLPGHDGIWLLRHVMESYPRLQRILLTAGDRASVDNLSRSINEAGVHRFVAKPWSNDALVRTIQECIEQWRAVAERERLSEMLRESNRVLETKVRDRTRDLERASRDWRRTFDAIADPMVLIDEELRIRRANLAAAALAEVDIRSLLGRKCHDALFGRTAACPECPLGDLHSAPKVGARLTDARNGRRFRVAAWSMVEEGQTPVSGENVAVCHYKDITEELELQNQMLMLEKIAAVGELAGCVAHELNNPLTGILTFSQLLSRLTDGTDPESHSMANEIEDAARRCRNIVQALLDYARPAGQVDFADVSLSELLDSVLNLATVTQAVARRVEIERIQPANVPWVRGNLDGLKSVFLNLLTNANQAMGGQGHLRIKIAALDDEHMVEVEVMDSGPGIPASLRNKIFEPFFTTKAQNKSGTGLGLAIVRNVVRDHGGSVAVGDAPGGGALFSIRLPMATPKGSA